MKAYIDEGCCCYLKGACSDACVRPTCVLLMDHDHSKFLAQSLDRNTLFLPIRRRIVSQAALQYNTLPYLCATGVLNIPSWGKGLEADNQM